MVATPECDKMLAVQEKSQAIGEFLEWLQSGEVEQNLPMKRSIFLAAYRVKCEDRHGEMLEEGDWTLSDVYIDPYTYSTERLLAEFFGIDLEKAEKEKRALLEEMRKCQDATPKGPASTTTGPESR